MDIGIQNGRQAILKIPPEPEIGQTNATFRFVELDSDIDIRCFRLLAGGVRSEEREMLRAHVLKFRLMGAELSQDGFGFWRHAEHLYRRMEAVNLDSDFIHFRSGGQLQP